MGNACRNNVRGRQEIIREIICCSVAQARRGTGERVAANQEYQYDLRLRITVDSNQTPGTPTAQPLPIYVRLLFFPQGEDSIKSPYQIWGY